MSFARSAAFHVELTDRASLDLESIYNDINAESSDAAAAWFNGLEEAVFSLEWSPERGPETREYSRVRQLLYGHKPHLYRILYSIQRSTRHVIVLHIRHGARDAFNV
jgi:plasmid stabilization system protein ParE